MDQTITEPEVVRTMSYSPTVDEYLNTILVLQQKSLRALRVIYSILGAILVIVALFVVDRNGGNFLGLLFAGVFTLLFMLVLKPFIRLISRPHLVGKDNVNLYVNQRVIVDKSRLRIESDNGIRSEIPWPAFRRMRVIDSTAYLMLTKQSALVIPQRAFPKEEDWQTFLDLCSSKIDDSKL